MRFIELMEEVFPSVKTYTPTQIAKKHSVSVKKINKQLQRGIKIEYEHTRDKKAAREIALDHLLELPDYYDRLENMEKNSIDEASVMPFNKNPTIGWWLDQDPITFYHGTHKDRVDDILRSGLRAPVEGPTAGWVSLALEPSTARGYASMHGGESSFRKAGGKAQHIPMQDRRVLVIQIPKEEVLSKMAAARGNMDNERDKLTNEERYRKWVASGKTDQEYYALTEIRMPKEVPSKYIKGWMQKS